MKSSSGIRNGHWADYNRLPLRDNCHPDGRELADPCQGRSGLFDGNRTGPGKTQTSPWLVWMTYPLPYVSNSPSFPLILILMRYIMSLLLFNFVGYEIAFLGQKIAVANTVIPRIKLKVVCT